MKKKISILLLCMIGMTLTGCGTTSSVTVSSAIPTTTASSLKLIDERPTEQKHSFKETDSTGVNSHFGDDNLHPSGPELLTAALQKKLSNQLAGKTVALTNFNVTVFEPSVSAPYPRATDLPKDRLGESFALLIESMRSEKTVQVQIIGKVDSFNFAGSNSEQFQGRVTSGNLNSVIEKTLDDVVAQIESLIR